MNITELNKKKLERRLVDYRNSRGNREQYGNYIRTDVPFSRDAVEAIVEDMLEFLEALKPRKIICAQIIMHSSEDNQGLPSTISWKAKVEMENGRTDHGKRAAQEAGVQP